MKTPLWVLSGHNGLTHLNPERDPHGLAIWEIPQTAFFWRHYPRLALVPQSFLVALVCAGRVPGITSAIRKNRGKTTGIPQKAGLRNLSKDGQIPTGRTEKVSLGLWTATDEMITGSPRPNMLLSVGVVVDVGDNVGIMI